jgi:uncharacterized protein YbaR (Trm112 family)
VTFDLKKEARQTIFCSQSFQEIMSKKISEKLLAILICPLCKSDLAYDDKNSELICHKSKLAYKIRDGIPVMLIDEARQTET